MQLDLGLVPQSRQQQDLYTIAYHCAACHDHNGCNTCTVCRYNVNLLGYEPNEVRMIKARAQIDFAQKKQRGMFIRGMELPLSISMCIFILILLCLPLLARPRNTHIPYDQVAVEAAILRTHQTIRDVDRDGFITCIDWAIRFYEIYPDSRIIHCNDYIDFNHLLNKVGDKYIEPQVLDGNARKAWRAFMGSSKEDVTYAWKIWATQKEW